MGRDRLDLGYRCRCCCFNPRARMGRDEAHHQDYAKPLVSIHAPAWGATLGPYLKSLSFHVSIHAPAWGATAGSSAWCSSSHRFNPRARMGRDSHFRTIEKSCIPTHDFANPLKPIFQTLWNILSPPLIPLFSSRANFPRQNLLTCGSHYIINMPSGS